LNEFGGFIGSSKAKNSIANLMKKNYTCTTKSHLLEEQAKNWYVVGCGDYASIFQA